VFKEEGLEELDAQIRRELDIRGKNKVFYRLFRRNGDEISTTDMTDWPEVKYNTDVMAHVLQDEPVFKTVTVSDHKSKARIAYGVIDNDIVIQVGTSLEEDKAFLDALKNVYTVSLPLLMFIAGFLGWFMAKKALQGVNAVTEAANDISQGELDRRIPQTGRGDEIDRLAVTLNSMMDRIQTLIRSMREMTDNIAHDLRSPLARIRGMAETSLTNTHSVSDFQSIAADTVEECDRLLHMINTMLDITETETGVVNLAISSVELSNVAAEACELFGPTAEDKGIKLSCNNKNKAIFVDGNIHYLQRLISNLIDNALKYTTNDGKVSIDLRREPDHAVLTVQDTGIGIDPEDLQNIFKRFYRCDMSRSQPGSGLGLSLALAIVHVHKGNIRVESIPGKGSKFIVSFPLSQHQY